MVTSIAEKLEDFLANEPKIPDDIIFRASHMFNNKLVRFNFKRRGGARLRDGDGQAEGHLREDAGEGGRQAAESVAVQREACTCGASENISD